MCLTLCAPWTGACQAPLSMEFSRQENWSGLPCPSPTFLRILFEFNTSVATTSVTFLTPLDDVLGVRPCLAAVLSSVPMTGGVTCLHVSALCFLL